LNFYAKQATELSTLMALRESKDFPGISSLCPVFQFLFAFLISSAEVLHINSKNLLQ